MFNVNLLSISFIKPTLSYIFTSGYIMNTVEYLMRTALATAVIALPLSAHADIFGKINKALDQVDKVILSIDNLLSNNK